MLQLNSACISNGINANGYLSELMLAILTLCGVAQSHQRFVQSWYNRIDLDLCFDAAVTLSWVRSWA